MPAVTPAWSASVRRQQRESDKFDMAFRHLLTRGGKLCNPGNRLLQYYKLATGRRAFASAAAGSETT